MALVKNYDDTQSLIPAWPSSICKLACHTIACTTTGAYKMEQAQVGKPMRFLRIHVISVIAQSSTHSHTALPMWLVCTQHLMGWGQSSQSRHTGTR